jgi:hypothetical protein
VLPVDKFKVRNCAEYERLTTKWWKAIDKHADAVKLLQSVDYSKFQEQYQERYKASRAAGECVADAFQARELHRTKHQC